MNVNSTARLLGAAIFLPLLAGTQAKAAAVPPAAQAAIQTAYGQINSAFAQHDMDRFMTFFAPDYKVVDEKGATYDKAQTRKQYADQLKQVKTMQSKFTVQDFTLTPVGVEVNMTLHTQGIGQKRVLFMTFKGTYTDDLQVHDLWVQTPQGWRIKSRKTLLDKLVTLTFPPKTVPLAW